ncbi:hypothetical protein EYF80_027018 [Liparis tanakae]|uniref:Uncharacterized protein n=1 Tax=Liparis tanakae TaxID=230148 RepID=A0A4Z2HDB6_9TELE|nr:hypothetical protein EYF80_027018 [Liparis tanakae]
MDIPAKYTKIKIQQKKKVADRTVTRVLLLVERCTNRPMCGDHGPMNQALAREEQEEQEKQEEQEEGGGRSRWRNMVEQHGGHGEEDIACTTHRDTFSAQVKEYCSHQLTSGPH